MKNKAIIILLFIVAGLFAALYMMVGFPFSNEPEIDDFSVKSNDELAILSIPVNALPDNVDIDDVSVTKASNIVTENGTWVVYELEPDGLVFKEEVLFNVTLENVNNTLPIVLISNESGIELVNNTFIDNDLENHTQIVSIPLSHFSRTYLYHDVGRGTFILELFVPPVEVGDKVKTTAKFTFDWGPRPKVDRTGTGDGISVIDLLDPPWAGPERTVPAYRTQPQIIYEGTWINDDKINIFTPVGSLGGKPSSTHVRRGSNNAFHDDTFTSDAEGKSYLTYKAEITVNLTLSHYDSIWDYEYGKKASSSRNYLKQKIVLFSKVPVYCETRRLIIQSTISTSYEFKPESSLIAEIQGPRDAAGFVTLTGSGMDPMKKPLLLGPGGSTRITFTHTFKGEVTLLVEVGDQTDERKINVG